MDGRGRWMDNLFVERLWCSLKYESVYLVEPENRFEAELMIEEWLKFYNRRRPCWRWAGGAGRSAMNCVR